MIVVVQRVSRASVATADGGRVAEIGPGLCVLLGVIEGDDEQDARWMARKLVNLRIFPDDEGRMNRSVRDIGGAILLVSQFTLAAEPSRGHRPSFVAAAPPEVAEPLCDRVANLIRAEGVPVSTGVFGGTMTVEITNEGPVTIILDSRR